MRKHKTGRLIGAPVLMALVFAAGCLVRPSVANLDSRGIAIICFGDSVTYGYGAAEGRDYPSTLRTLGHYPVINAGINGDTTREALKRLDTDVLERDPLLVIIEFGANDLIARIPFEETAANIEEMIRRIQARGAMVAVVDVSSAMVMEDYGQEFRRLSRKNNAIFIPRIMEGIFANPAMRSDYIHPNAQGYRLIAHRVYRAIVPYLTRNAFNRAAIQKGPAALMNATAPFAENK